MLGIFAKIPLQFGSSLEQGFKHPFKENIGPQSWYPATPMALSVRGTSPDTPEQRDVQDSAIMRSAHKWPTR